MSSQEILHEPGIEHDSPIDEVIGTLPTGQLFLLIDQHREQVGVLGRRRYRGLTDPGSDRQLAFHSEVVQLIAQEIWRREHGAS
jgi:hypothetical protein